MLKFLIIIICGYWAIMIILWNYATKDNYDYGGFGNKRKKEN